MRVGNYKTQTLERIPMTFCRGAEIGVWEGGLSRFLLESRPNLHLLLVDPWDHASRPIHNSRDCETAKANVYRLADEFSGRVQIFPVTSLKAASEIDNGSLDFFFLDAIHTREAIAADSSAWLPKLKTDGWYGGRDFVGRWYDQPEDFRCGLAKPGCNRNWYVDSVSSEAA